MTCLPQEGYTCTSNMVTVSGPVRTQRYHRNKANELLSTMTPSPRSLLSSPPRHLLSTPRILLLVLLLASTSPLTSRKRNSPPSVKSKRVVGQENLVPSLPSVPSLVVNALKEIKSTVLTLLITALKIA